VRLGYNYRLSDVQSAIARVQLRKLGRFVEERDRLARRYDAAFEGSSWLRLPPRRPGVVHSYQSYVVVVEDDAPVSARDLMDALSRQGVSTRVGTYAVHREPYWTERFPAIRLPASEQAAERSVALPLFNGLDHPSQDRVIEAVRNAAASMR
jgi:dTDP-4-amino-4,6-dideoxygalactose transaminase